MMIQPDNPQDDLAAGLRLLIKQWEAQARAADVHQMDYQHGLAEAFKQAARAVRELLGEADAPVETKPAPVMYQPVAANEVRAMLARIGLNVRMLYNHNDNAFSAVFSRLHPMSQEERLRALAGLDQRIVVLDSGKMPDTNEFYIDFAFGPPATP